MTRVAKPIQCSVDEVRAVFDYNPETGVVVWKRRTCRGASRIVVGSRAGWVDVGSRRISIFGQDLVEHRLIWFWMTGIDPDNQIDHKDRNPHNNKWSNLRLATASQNMANRCRSAPTKCKLKGAYLSDSGKYIAQIGVGRKTKHLGVFDSPEEAHLVFTRAAKELHGEFYPEE